MTTVTTEIRGSIDHGAHLIPPPKEMDKKSDKEVRKLITCLINSVAGATLDGAEKVSVIARAQYYMDELTRRSQDRQTQRIVSMTEIMTGLTAAIGLMTVVIMVVTVWLAVRPQ